MMALITSGTMVKTTIKAILFLMPISVNAQRKMFNQNNFTVSSGGCAYSDVNAAIYINAVVAAGVTGSLVDTTHRCAIHKFVVDEKAAGDWAANVAIYFCPWQNAAANAINMKTPGTYDLVFTGSPTMGSTGVAWNGTTQFASTGIKQNVLSQDDAHISYYSQTNNTTNLGYEIGATDGTTLSALRIRSSTATGGHASVGLNSSTTNSLGALGSVSLVTVSKTSSSSGAAYRAGSSFATYTNGASSVPGITYNYYLGANNNNGTAANFSIRTMSYADFGPGYSSAQETVHYTNVQTLHTSFSISQ